jgi:uncharacterized protein (DUF2147 family)
MGDGYGSNVGKRLISLVILLAVWGAYLALHTLPMAAAADTPKPAGIIDEQRLIGRWVRPDGGYVLELKEIGKDGTTKASYFNPRPINVSKAEVRRSEGEITVFIELRDVNYPGSTYNLRYDPTSDRLTGTYFQAVYGETYQIEFRRIR